MERMASIGTQRNQFCLETSVVFMNDLKNFLSLLLEHTGKAFSILTLLLVDAEYLVPGSILPFLNLYFLGAGSVLLLAAFPGQGISSKWKTRALIFSMGLICILVTAQVLAPFSKTKSLLIVVLAGIVITLPWLHTEGESLEQED